MPKLFRLIPIALSLLVASSALADGRVALLIGNADYDSSSFDLNNPVNDIDALAPALQRLGFSVRKHPNAASKEMRSALADFRREAAGAEIAFVFYAGHGIQAANENYLVGTEVAQSEVARRRLDAVVESSVTLNQLQRALDDADADLSIIVLDACRDNPLQADGIVPTGLQLENARGAGMLIAYSTDPGNVAQDGSGANSPFTRALLENLEMPGLEVRLMFGRVRQQVMFDTQTRQIPWLEESVIGEHYLAEGPRQEQASNDVAAWRRADTQGSVEAIRSYLAAYPDGFFAQIAENRLRSLRQDQGGVEATPISADEAGLASAALELLGYLSPSRGQGAPELPVVQQAYEGWREDQPAGLGNFNVLLRDGAQMALLLGTYTAGVLRKDMQNFAAIEQTIALAEADLARVQSEFGDDPANRQVIEAIAGDVAFMQQTRDEMAAQLDASRSYYHELVVLTEGGLNEWMAGQLLPRFGGTRGSLQQLPVRVFEDARTFVGHIDLMSDRPKGSYAWLAEFIEEVTQ